MAEGWTYASDEVAPEREPERRSYRRNPARTWTVIAVVAALLMVGALVAIYYIGPQQMAAWVGGGMRIGILTGGGDVPGLNPCIRSSPCPPTISAGR
jgi:hypothetical protein